MLRRSGATGGLLPKVIAAYNAGLLPVAKWNAQIHDLGDPLLWMESVPFWETRGYVATVLRNYWMYEGQAGKAPGRCSRGWPGPDRCAFRSTIWSRPRAHEYSAMSIRPLSFSR